MPKTDIKIHDLIGMIERGELRLPEMQRKFVWTATRVRDLFDSLYRGYPSGSILVWETDQEQPTRDLAIDQGKSPFYGHKLLLDGQQRLTSLSVVIQGKPVTVRGRKRPIDLLFNLEHPDTVEEVLEVEDDEILNQDDELEEIPAPEEESIETSLPERLKKRTFVVYARSLENDPHWIQVTDVFSGKSDWELLKSRVTGPEDPKYQKYSERLSRLRKIRDYQYVMQILDRNLSYEEVAEIFVRVNSLGAKLRGSDLALAQITAKWRNSLDLFEQFREDCAKQGFSLDLGLIVRTLIVFATGQSRFKTVGSLTESHLQNAWKETRQGITFAMDFLRANAGIEDVSLLSSPYFVIAYAVVGVRNRERLKPEEERILLHWLYVANAKGHYSGSSETTLDSDLSIILRQNDLKGLLAQLQAQFGRLTIEPEDLNGRNWRSPLYSTAFLAMKRRGAKDWRSGLEISYTHSGKSNKIESHHIFPKSILKERGVDKRTINEIANLAFIGGATNRWISNRPPEVYLPQVLKERGEEGLIRHGIPIDAGYWKIENYPKFLVWRRSALAHMINDLFESVDSSDTKRKK